MAISKSLRFQILRRDSHTCRYCGRSAPEVKLTVDHVTPEALGGRTEPANLVTACGDCNNGKSATPPDAALVVDVDADALRWSRAIAAAAERMLADRDARQEIRDEFEAAWNGWTFTTTKQPVPLPADWGATVDRFLAAGLPMPILLDCINITMGADKVKDRFRYMCGVAWKMVGELHDAARADLAPTTAAQAPASDPNTVTTGTLVAMLKKVLDNGDPPPNHWEYDRIVLEYSDALDALVNR